jgi:Capsule polysaccharide biosynthesis protein
MRVMLHGFGSFPLFFYHVIECARQLNPDVEWAIVLTSDHHQSLFEKLLGENNVLVLNQSGKALSSLTELTQYHGSIYKDLGADKRTFKSERSSTKLNRAVRMYAQVKTFTKLFKPTHALVSQVEGFDGKVFIAVAKELGVEVVVPTSCRNMRGIYFSTDDLETLPCYTDATDPLARVAAAKFIAEFRNEPKAANWLQDLANEKQLSGFQQSFCQRTGAQLRRWFSAPSLFQWDDFRASFLNNLPFVRDFIWTLRKEINSRVFDLDTIDSLPAKFIYYPLQYSPESSINTPAPYFLDQSRAIDAIRFAMPSDYVLVVKEHPACILIRNGAFVKSLKKTAGVMVAQYQLPSIELTKRAAITISVTGTATLEALIMGKPSIALGPGLCAELLGGLCPLGSLENKIAECLAKPVPDERVVAQLSRLFSVRHEVSFGSPGMPNEPILREGNVSKFTGAFFDHCRRVRHANNKG